MKLFFGIEYKLLCELVGENLCILAVLLDEALDGIFGALG